jgi:rhamnulokinase
MPRVFGAIDVGASSGRVVAGIVNDQTVTITTVHRFGNSVSLVDGHLRWDFEQIWAGIVEGLARLAAAYPEVESVGIDTWGCDYGLVDRSGELLADPIAYRDGRTTDVIDRVHEILPPETLYGINGLQFLPFSTLYQLKAEQTGDVWDRAAHALLIPDLIAFRLTGELATEVTNASTTGLLDAANRSWSDHVMRSLDIPDGLFPSLVNPGTVRGSLRPEIAEKVGFRPGTVVTSVGSHDTASAVAGIPLTSPTSAYVVSGTWSLVGLELPAPLITERARIANFTNELGLDGRTRFLRNVGGLWLLQESLRQWAEDGEDVDLESLLRSAAELPSGGPTIDVDDPTFIPPGDMPTRVADAAEASGGRRPRTPVAITRCIVDSLARGYASTIDNAAQISGRDVEVVHIVGGGALNELLCQRTSDLTGRRVVAGPVEATALGNICTQAGAHGALSADLETVRSSLRPGSVVATYVPRENDSTRGGEVGT